MTNKGDQMNENAPDGVRRHPSIAGPARVWRAPRPEILLVLVVALGVGAAVAVARGWWT